MPKALLVIDVQNEYFSGKMPITYPERESSLANILAAMDAAHQQGISIVMIQHASPDPAAAAFRRGSEGWELHPEVARRPHTTLIEKSLPGSFTGTNLQEWLQANKIDTVVISGYMTQHCCDNTAKQAFHLGYKVEFLADATGTLNLSNSAGTVTAEELHRAIVVGLQFRVSQVITTAQWVESISQPVAT